MVRKDCKYLRLVERALPFGGGGFQPKEYECVNEAVQYERRKRARPPCKKCSLYEKKEQGQSPS